MTEEDTFKTFNELFDDIDDAIRSQDLQTDLETNSWSMKIPKEIFLKSNLWPNGTR